MSSEGQAKVSLILELKNRLKTGLQQAKEHLNKNVTDMKGKLNSLRNSHVEAFRAMGNEMPGFARGLELIRNKFVLVAAAATLFATLSVNAAKWSAGWERNMAEVNVTAQLSRNELDLLSKKLVDIGTRNVAPLEEVPKAFNRIISSGLDVNTSLKVLEPTLRAAKAGFTDIETVAAAGVGVMASSGEDINRVYDVLFATLNKGNAKFQDIAQYLPKIIPLAKGAGFALGETAGAWAFLTSQGQTAEQSTTGVMNMMKMLSNVDTIKGMKGLGISIYDSTGKVRPLVEIIDQLSVKMNGLSDSAKTNFLDKAGITDMEAKGALLSMVQNVGKLREITDFTTNSAGQLNIAYDKAGTSMDSWAIIMNKIKGNVIKPLGDAVLGLVGKIGNWVLSTINWFKDLYNKSLMIQEIFSAIGSVISFTFRVILAPIKLAYEALLGFANIFKKLNVRAFVENIYYGIRPIFVWLTRTVEKVSEILVKFFTGKFRQAWQAIRAFSFPSLDDIRNEQEKEIAARKANKKEENPFSATASSTGTAGAEGSVPANNGPVGSDSINSITGSAKQIRNISVNIDSFVKGMSISNKNMQQMDDKQLEDFFTDMFLRVIRNLETAY